MTKIHPAQKPSLEKKFKEQTICILTDLAWSAPSNDETVLPRSSRCDHGFAHWRLLTGLSKRNVGQAAKVGCQIKCLSQGTLMWTFKDTFCQSSWNSFAQPCIIFIFAVCQQMVFHSLDRPLVYARFRAGTMWTILIWTFIPTHLIDWCNAFGCRMHLPSTTIVRISLRLQILISYVSFTQFR